MNEPTAPKEKTIRINLTVRPSDWRKAEWLRVQLGERSCSAVVRKLIRAAATGRGYKP